jgi:hypothetical protein
VVSPLQAYFLPSQGNEEPPVLGKLPYICYDRYGHVDSRINVSMWTVELIFPYGPPNYIVSSHR